MAHPATEKRGGNPDVKQKPEGEKPKDTMERKLEQGLEESMTGSDPVSVTQPPKGKRAESGFRKREAPPKRGDVERNATQLT